MSERVIHKIVMVSPTEPVMYSLPKFARIVGAGAQGRYTFVFWYERGTRDTPVQDRWELCIVGTGIPYPADYDYQAGPIVVGNFVFHLVGKKVQS